MSDEINQGGPAFPIPYGQVMMEEGKGMTLRDYFAGQALSGIMANPAMSGSASVRSTKELLEHCSLAAFNLADAMIAQRNKKD